MNKSLALALIIGGFFLTLFGLIAYNSTSSDFTRFFTSSPTDKSIWLLVGGITATIVGLYGATHRRKAVL